MMRFSLPYDNHKIQMDLPDNDRIHEIEAHTEMDASTTNQEDVIRQALENPIDSQRLSDLAFGKKDVLIITSDHTRPVPSRITLPLLIEELRRKNRGIKISVLVATGLHRSTSKSEMIEKFGEELLATCDFHIHDAEDRSNLCDFGVLPSGGKLCLNRMLEETELLIAEGFIEPHFFAGFSGGRKSVLPGVAAAESIRYNHSYKMINHINNRSGILEGNVINADMEYAAKKADLRFILNVVLDSEKNVVSAFAGDCIHAHRQGSEMVRKTFAVPKKMGNIVITSAGGYPLDQNLYQLVKAIYSANICCKDGGVIIAVAGCRNGIGGESFEKQISENGTAAETLDRFSRINPEKTEYDQWQSQILLQALKSKKVIVCTEGISKTQVEELKMLHASDIQDALQTAEKLIKEPEYVVIPDGIGVIIN